MRQNLISPILLAAGLLTATEPTDAAPLQRSHIMQQPLWVAHIDADSLRQGVLGRHILAELEKPEAEEKFAAFQAIFSFDPRKALHGVTLYGASKDAEDGVLLVYADFDAARLTTLASGAEDHQAAAHRQYTIHNWLDSNRKNRHGAKVRTYAAIRGDCVVFAQKQARVADALDVLDGLKPNLSGDADFARLGAGPAFLHAAARRLDLPEGDPNAALFKRSKMVSLTMGETQQQVQVTLTLEAETAEIAGHIEAVARGLLGLLTLQKEKPEAVKLAQALSIQRAGDSVVVNLALPATEFIQILQAADARKKAAAQ